MPILSRRGLPLLGLAALAAARAQAQGADPVRIRGTIVSLDGDVLRVVTRREEQLVVTLASNALVAAMRRVTFADVKPGISVGVVAEPGSDGELRATTITVLPPGVRINEMQIAWDSAPNASMNNGSVEAVVDSSAGHDLTLKILGRRVLVRVPADTPLLMPITATRADLVPGATISISAMRGADGKISSDRVMVSKDGVEPTM